MGLRRDCDDLQTAVKAFPWRRRGVLLPAHDRKAAALGVCMFTACKPHILVVQSACFWGVRLLGVHALPGRTLPWAAPFTPETWSMLVGEWRSRIGPFDAMAIYQRRQVEREGLTLLLTRDGAAVAVVKVRSAIAALEREQAALAAVAVVGPSTFRAPRALGSGTVARNLHWSAQTCVFDRPHGPAFDVPDRFFEELTACLEQIPGSDPGNAPAHNDLTPWNLRRDHQGVVWLYDWEDWGAAPDQADRVYFCATASALTRRPMPRGLPRAAVEHWREWLTPLDASNPADLALDRKILAALDQALRNPTEPDTDSDTRLESPHW